MSEYPLWSSQVEDLAFFMANPRAGNFSDPGTGKTPITCVWFEWLWKYKGIKGVFSGPKSLLQKNYNEFFPFTSFLPDEIQIIDGNAQERKEQMGNRKAKVFLMGYKRFADDWEYILKLHPNIGAHAIDEWHLGFKTNQAERTQQLYRAMERIPYMMPMTGSPIDGGLHTVYPLIRLIAPYYYPAYETFMNQHAIFDPDYGGVVAWRGHDKIKKILGAHSIRRTFEEIHGDQFPFITAEPCKMNPAQAKAYTEMHEQGMSELEDDFLIADGGGVATLRCRQILACPEIFGIKGTNGRDEALKDHLRSYKQTGKPLIIYSALVPEQERVTALCKKLGLKVQLINGKVKNPNIDKEFREGKYQIVVASSSVASVGFNWPHVDHIIFLSLDYADTNFTQAFKRAIRGKRKTPLLVTLLFYPGTIERRVCGIIDKKARTAHQVDKTFRKLFLQKAIDKATYKL